MTHGSLGGQGVGQKREPDGQGYAGGDVDARPSLGVQDTGGAVRYVVEDFVDVAHGLVCSLLPAKGEWAEAVRVPDLIG